MMTLKHTQRIARGRKLQFRNYPVITSSKTSTKESSNKK